MQERIYPLTFKPAYRDYIWGGRNLEKLGRRLPVGIVAESWEISGHPSSPTMVDAGLWRGRTLTELMRELGLELVGEGNADALARGRFPLLVKLLDASQDLSVQVHPSDAYAQVNEGGETGKAEMWYFLRARPEAKIIFGLRPGVTSQSLREAILSGRLEPCLSYLPVSQGDAVYLGAGAVHALLAGVMVVEIQQTSDLTYRVFDWNRVGHDGLPRPLHVEKALEVIDFSLVEPRHCQPVEIERDEGWVRERLVQCEHFVVERLSMGTNGVFSSACGGDTFEIWGCIAGDCSVAWDGPSVMLPAVRFVLLPAALGRFQFTAHTPATLLRAWTPGTLEHSFWSLTI